MFHIPQLHRDAKFVWAIHATTSLKQNDFVYLTPTAMIEPSPQKLTGLT